MSESSASKRGLPTQVKMRHDQHFVDELTTRHRGEAVGSMLAITTIEPDPNQPRSSMGDLGELIEYGDTDTIFTNPSEKRTEDYITGRYG